MAWDTFVCIVDKGVQRQPSVKDHVFYNTVSDSNFVDEYSLSNGILNDLLGNV